MLSKVSILYCTDLRFIMYRLVTYTWAHCCRLPVVIIFTHTSLWQLLCHPSSSQYTELFLQNMNFVSVCICILCGGTHYCAIESNLARPVIIHDIIHSLMCMPSTPTLWIFWGLARWKLRLRPLRFFYVQLKVSQTSHLIYVVLWAPRHDIAVLVYTAPGSPRRSPIQLWTSSDVA